MRWIVISWIGLGCLFGPSCEARAEGASAASPPPAGPGVVRVHVETGDPRVRLKIVTGTRTQQDEEEPQGVDLCAPPCGVLIDASGGEEFYFDGEKLSTSPRFTLFDRSGDVFIKVEPRGSALRSLGDAMVYVGNVATFAGGIAAGLGSSVDDASPELVAGGLISMGAGLALWIGGAVFRASRETGFHIVTPRGAPSAAAPMRSPSGLVFRF